MLGAAKSFLADGSQEAICHLYVRFYLINNDPFTIGELVGNAMKTRQITRTDFTILTEKPRFDCTQNEFTDYGRRFRLFFDAFHHVFARIISLKLSDIRLTDTDITSILGMCKKLGYLWLRHCGSEHRSLIQIDHQELSELVFESCSFERIHLRRCPKLRGLTFRSWDSLGDPLSFGYVPCLQKLNLTNFGVGRHKTLKLSELLVNSTVTRLFMNLKSGKIWIQPEGRKLISPLLQKLQVLTIVDIPEKCDLTWLVFLLEAAPVLKKLNIMVRDHTCQQAENEDLDTTSRTIEWEPSNLKHRNLSELYIHGFESNEKFTKFIKLIMKAAINLEKIYLGDKTACEWCDKPDQTDSQTQTTSAGSKYPTTYEAKYSALQQLTGGEYSRIKLSFSRCKFVGS